MSVNLLSPESRERLPLVPYSGHCGRAISFFNLPEVFFGLGKTSAWVSDELTDPDFIPPEPSMEDSTIQELVGMKAATRKLLVMPDDNGEIEYRNSNWTIISEAQAIENNARWVLVETTIYYDELPVNNYRQIGIFSRVQRAEGVPSNQAVLLADDIADTGILEVIDNRHVVTRQADTKDVYQMIIEF